MEGRETVVKSQKSASSKRQMPVHGVKTQPTRNISAPKTSFSAKNSHANSYDARAEKTTTWQNPIINYFTTKTPRFGHKKLNQSKPAQTGRRIMAMLAFFSISIGLWENFRQLWLQSNGFSAAEVGNIISFGTIIGAIGVVVVGKFVPMTKLKTLMTWTLVVRCVNFGLLALLNQSGLRIIIDFFALVEIFTALLFLIAIYPLMTILMKNNQVYSRRRLVEYLFRDVGILIGGIFIGQQLGNFVFDYNACLLLALGFLIVAAVILYRLEIKVTEQAPKQKFSAVKYIWHDKIQRVYMTFVLFSEISNGAVMGLRMLMLTDMFGFSAGIATNYLLVAGLIADFLGILALRYFTPQNDYLTITLKFGVRFVIFSLAAISGNDFLCFLALTWMIFSNTAYEHVTNGYYINAVDNRYQFKYNTVRNVVQYVGTAIGIFLCGLVFDKGAGAVFEVAAVILAIQLIPAYTLVYLRQKQWQRPRSRLKH